MLIVHWHRITEGISRWLPLQELYSSPQSVLLKETVVF